MLKQSRRRGGREQRRAALLRFFFSFSRTSLFPSSFFFNSETTLFPLRLVSRPFSSISAVISSSPSFLGHATYSRAARAPLARARHADLSLRTYSSVLNASARESLPAPSLVAPSPPALFLPMITILGPRPRRAGCSLSPLIITPLATFASFPSYGVHFSFRTLVAAYYLRKTLPSVHSLPSPLILPALSSRRWSTDDAES